MNIVIKVAKIEEALAISLLTQELGYAASEAETREWLSYMLESTNHGVFVATNEIGSICGWVVVERRVSLETGHKAEISGLVVGENFRRLGVAQQLIQAVEHWAIGNKLSKIVVSSNTQRNESHLFYKNSGFVLKKTSHKYEKKAV